MRKFLLKEFELKFEVPADRVEAVAAEFKPQAAREARMQAQYYDTGDGLLWHNGLSFRLRREGERWVQAVKGRGGSLLERREHEVVLGAMRGDAPPDIDPWLHRGAPVGEALLRLLKRAGKGKRGVAALQVVYETDVGRRLEQVQFQGSRIEVAFDQGRLVAGPRSAMLCEVEFELKEGRPEDAVALAKSWCLRHRLWLNTVSKAERGRRLAAGLLFGEPVTAPPLREPRHAAEISRLAVANCLDHILGNASEVALGSADADHIHQLRVGIRRLRTAVRDLPLESHPGSDWEAPLVEVFRGLGRHRDQRHVAVGLEPVIEEAGGPLLSVDAAAEPVPEPQDLVRSPQFQDALLKLIEWQHTPGALKAEGATRKKLRHRLDKLRKQALADGKRFTELDEEHQHRVRKRLKRLRYLAEFAAPLFDAGKAKAFQKELRPVQDALGLYNDELMALRTYRRLARKDPKAWFGAGWLSGRAAINAKGCSKVIRKFSAADPYWR